MALTRYVGVGREGTFGTAVAATRYIETVARLPPDSGWIVPDPICDPSHSKYNAGPYRVRGTMGPFPITADNIGEIINAIMGNESYTNTGPSDSAYLHDWKCSGDLDSYTVRLGAEHEERIIPGMLGNQATFKAVHGENLQGTVEWVGPGAAESTGSLASLTRANLSSLQPFVYNQASGLLSIGGSDRSAVVFDFEIVINNNIPHERGNFNTRYMPKMRRGKRLVTGKISAYFDDDDEYDRFIAEAAFALDFKFQGALIGSATKYEIRWYIPVAIYLRECDHRIQPIDAPLVLDAPFQAFYDATDTELHMYLQNAESGNYT